MFIRGVVSLLLAEWSSHGDFNILYKNSNIYPGMKYDFLQLLDFFFLFTESATVTRSSDHVNQSPAPLSPLTKGQAGVSVRIITDPTTGLQYAVCPLVCPSVPIRGEVTATPLSPTLSLKGGDHTGAMASSSTNDL